MSRGRVKVGRNEPCPCGTGRKYKNCCWDKGFTWVRDEDGQISREIPLNDEARAALVAAGERFRSEHGRDPGPEDLLFQGHPEHHEHQVVEAMKAAGIRPALIHAYQRTGMIVTEDNLRMWPQAALDEWDAATEEYEAMHDEGS